jgi:hypothetical protein
MERDKYIYAEVRRADNIINHISEAPFLPDFGEGFSIRVVDVTDIDPLPTVGWLWNGMTAEPAPESEPTPEPYIGELTLDIITGGVFNSDKDEVNATVGCPVVVTGSVTDAVGNVLPVDMSLLRLPILPADLNGNPLTSAQPSLAVASISQGTVTAEWTPEYTGTYAITEDAINIRLPDGAKLRFKGLAIFIMPHKEI